MAWQETELECVNFIKRIVPNYIKVIEEGGSDSTAPDIVLKKNNEVLFCVEVKEATSQAGQFVIIEDKNSYKFSKLNKVCEEPCLPIINYINQNIINYKNIGQSGISVDCDIELTKNRIVNLYLNEKNTKFFITKSKDEFLIFKTEDILNYFDISCVARRKKSGSANIPSKCICSTKETVRAFFDEKNLKSRFYQDGKKLFVEVDSNLDYSCTRIECDCFTIYLSKSKSNTYELRKLSNTNNPNIIFTLKLKTNHSATQQQLFLNMLK